VVDQQRAVSKVSGLFQARGQRRNRGRWVGGPWGCEVVTGQEPPTRGVADGMMSLRSARGSSWFGQTCGFCHAGPVGTGPVSDLPTHANTVPVTGYPRVSATHSHARRGRCLPYACLHSSKVSDLPSPLPPPSLTNLLPRAHLPPRAVSLAPSRCAASHLVSPLGPSPPLGRLACAISSMPSRDSS